MVLLFFRYPVPWRIEIGFKISEKGGCGWLRGCEQCEIYWIMHFVVEITYMHYEII